MTRASLRLLVLACPFAFALALAGVGPVRADAVDDSLSSEPALESPSVAAAPARAHELDALVPELADRPYHLPDGERPFLHRLSVSPGFGQLGSERLFTLRAAYNPNRWLAYEASLGHNPGHAVHALLHSFNAVVRHPLAGRLQPYLTGGYGMIVVFPGQAVNAKPVTKNTLAFGGGLECYVRGDLALRVDVQNATVIGQQRDHDGVVAYSYTQGTVGLAFYRSIRP